MTGKHRALPAWMAKKEEKEKEKEEPPRRRRKKRTTRAVFYAMNEKELIEAAVSCLTEGACQDVGIRHQEVEDQAVNTAVKMRQSPATSEAKTKPLTEESSDCSDAHETTYVSETDLDITEVATLPYARSPQLQGPEGQRSSGLGGLMEAEKKEEHPQMPADAAAEDDSLRLVREIFFS